MQIRNFGLTRITMDQIHDIIQDVEDLKYNDAQYQMNNELQNRDAQTKKGIYSDDFSNAAQSDIDHTEWDARVNEIGKFAAPDRTAVSTPLQVDQAASNVRLFGSLALLPGTEQVLLDQDDWSEERNIVVKVLDSGLEYQGRQYKSLSSIAREITGTKWNGFLFFGIIKSTAARRNDSEPERSIQ